MSWKILKPQTIQIKNLTARIFASEFGWLITGELSEQLRTNNKVYNLYSLLTTDTLDLNETLERLWLLENDIIDTELTAEEIECEENFLCTFTRAVKKVVLL